MTALAYMTLGAIVLVLGLVWTRGPRRGASALILFFAGTAAVISPLLVGGESETAYFVSLLMSLPSALMLAPAFGRYVDLTTTKDDDGSSLRRFALGHFVLPAVGGLVAGAYGLLSRPDRELMLVHGQLPDGTLAASIALATFILVLLWVPQSAFYLYYAAARIVGRYARARTHSNGVWQLLPPSIVGSVWLVVAIALLGDNLFGYSPVGLTTVAAMALVVTWSMAIWTLSTNPNPQPEPALEHAAKYERSALRPPRAQRIVAKLDDVMAAERLYLDSDLTLERLADAVGAPRKLCFAGSERHSRRIFLRIRQSTPDRSRKADGPRG